MRADMPKALQHFAVREGFEPSRGGFPDPHPRDQRAWLPKISSPHSVVVIYYYYRIFNIVDSDFKFVKDQSTFLMNLATSLLLLT